MIGVFLKNKDGKLCFAQPLQDTTHEIAAFRYDRETCKIAIILASGDEKTITTAISPEMQSSFLKETFILVVDLDEKAEFKREYKAPLTA